MTKAQSIAAAEEALSLAEARKASALANFESEVSAVLVARADLVAAQALPADPLPEPTLALFDGGTYTVTKHLDSVNNIEIVESATAFTSDGSTSLSGTPSQEGETDSYLYQYANGDRLALGWTGQLSLRNSDNQTLDSIQLTEQA
jgi:hypothetical protein